MQIPDTDPRWGEEQGWNARPWRSCRGQHALQGLPMSDHCGDMLRGAELGGLGATPQLGPGGLGLEPRFSAPASDPSTWLRAQPGLMCVARLRGQCFSDSPSLSLGGRGDRPGAALA